MTRHNVSVGRIMGIPIGLDYSWFLIVALLTWLLATSYYPGEFRHWTPAVYWITGGATALLLFASVLLHELGHSAVALRYGIPVRSINLFIFGGVAEIGAEPPTARAELFIAIAGPLVSLALAAAFWVTKPLVAGSEPVWGVFKYLAYINAVLVGFNLIPGYPLDGGRVFRAIVWAGTHDMRRATLIAANVGRFFGLLFIFVGVLQIFSGNLAGGVWIAVIGWFLDSAASAQASQVVFQGLLAGHRVAQAMGGSCTAIPADLTLQRLVDDHILAGGQRCFAVTRGGDTVGLMTVHRIKEVPREKWPTTLAGDVMLPLDKLKRVAPESEVWSALQEMDRDGVNQLPVMSGERMVGMLTREDVVSFLRTLRELGT
ncbi:MAG: site-2 protease family protein [Acidobacteriota bacterium]